MWYLSVFSQKIVRANECEGALQSALQNDYVCVCVCVYSKM